MFHLPELAFSACLWLSAIEKMMSENEVGFALLVEGEFLVLIVARNDWYACIFKWRISPEP